MLVTTSLLLASLSRMECGIIIGGKNVEYKEIRPHIEMLIYTHYSNSAQFTERYTR